MFDLQSYAGIRRSDQGSFVHDFSNDIFNNKVINCCGLYTLSIGDTLAAEYYMTVSSWMATLMDNAFANGIYGKETQMIYDIMNNFHYLAIYLNIIKKRREEYYELNGEDIPLSELYVTYNIKCIKKTFICKGYDIEPLLMIYQLAPEPSGVPDAVSPCLPALDGIDNMHIESGPTCTNTFIVR